MTNEVSPFNLFCHSVHGLSLFFNIKCNGFNDLPTFKFNLVHFHLQSLDIPALTHNFNGHTLFVLKSNY